MPSLGISNLYLNFIAMNRTKSIILNQTLTHYYGIFKIITSPWHISNMNIRAKCKFAKISCSSISNNISRLNFLTFFYKRSLVMNCILICPEVFF